MRTVREIAKCIARVVLEFFGRRRGDGYDDRQAQPRELNVSFPTYKSHTTAYKMLMMA